MFFKENNDVTIILIVLHVFVCNLKKSQVEILIVTVVKYFHIDSKCSSWWCVFILKGWVGGKLVNEKQMFGSDGNFVNLCDLFILFYMKLERHIAFVAKQDYMPLFLSVELESTYHDTKKS